MMPGIAQGFGDVRTNMPWWILGALIAAGGPEVERGTAINKYPQAAQTGKIVVDTSTNSATYTWTVNGVVLTYVADSSTSKIEIAAGIEAAINAEPLVRGQVTALSDGIDTVNLTGNTPGVAFTASDSDAKLTTTETIVAAAAAAVVEFGRAIVRVGMQNTDVLAAKADSALFTAQVITITPSGYVAGAVLTLVVYEVRDGERVQIGAVSETSATSLDATLDALATGINAQLPANSVDVASAPGTATTIVLTAEVAGLEIEAELYSDDSGASTPTATKAYTTGPSESTSFHRAWLGVVERDQGVGAVTIGGTEQQYPANAAMGYVRKGTIAVASAEAITAGADVYVELGVTADNGKFFAADSATRIPVSRKRAVWYLDADTNTGSLAALRLL